MTHYKSIVVLTGAGISAESGIQTFRASDGLWEEHRIDEVATPEGFKKNPALVQQFYNARRDALLHERIAANPAHMALAQLEREWLTRPGHQFLLITQNIDDLHERAGSEKLIHMHGELLKMRCELSQQVFTIHHDIGGDDICACCGEKGRLRPHIVWFGEMPLKLEQIYRALANCDLFLSVGTSGNVYPAAGFVQEAKQADAYTVEINLEPTKQNDLFDKHIYGKAGETLPAFVDSLLSR